MKHQKGDLIQKRQKRTWGGKCLIVQCRMEQPWCSEEALKENFPFPAEVLQIPPYWNKMLTWFYILNPFGLLPEVLKGACSDCCTLLADLFQKLFRQDLLVASLFRNFLLAERIMRSYNCTPVSSPRLPPTYMHAMW